MRNYIVNNLNKYSAKKKKRNLENLDGQLYLLIYVSWSASPQAYLIVYMLIKVYIFKC